MGKMMEYMIKQQDSDHIELEDECHTLYSDLIHMEFFFFNYKMTTICKPNGLCTVTICKNELYANYAFFAEVKELRQVSVSYSS